MPARKDYVMHVISNTHWDREWTKTYQEHRLMLADYLQRLMDLFDNDPEFKYFHLDSQTIPLEDFATVRPESVERLKGYISSGRLLVGPWYTLPEMNCLDGESIVRNLLMGHRVARQWGGVMKVGYNPTSNGQVSQLPQIYAGFGIDALLFYRGINADAADKEFYWKGADGTTALCEQFPDGRVVFWGIGILPVLYNMWPFKPETWKYTWDRPEVPFRMDDDLEYTIIETPELYNEDHVVPALTETRKWETKYATVRDLLYLDGMDQAPPYPNITRLIRDANRMMPGDRMVHDSLPNVMSILKKKVRGLKTLSGEMRLTNKSGRPGFNYLHPGILSTRMYLKQANRACEYALLRWAEPMAAMAWVLGEDYPASFIRSGLKTLFANHAHDDICGCSIDKVHEDMMYRFSEVSTLSEELTRRSLRAIVGRIDSSSCPPGSILVNLFNSLPFPRSEVIRASVDLPAGTNRKDVFLVDEKGRPVAFQPVSRSKHSLAVPQDGHTRRFEVRRITGFLQADMPALGYGTLRVVDRGASAPSRNIARSATSLENDHVKISIRKNGAFDLAHKKTGMRFKSLHVFEDNGERGNAWLIRAPENDTVVSSRNAPARVKLMTNGPLAATVRITIPLSLPKGLSADYQSRSSSTRTVTITSMLTLRQGTSLVEIETSLRNDIENHRLRVMFPSDVDTDTSLAEMPFDITKRSVKLPEDADRWLDRPSTNFPQVNFCCATDSTRGLAVINRGLTDYELVDDRRRTLALTLLRTFYQGDVDSTERQPDEGFQCFGEHTFNYAVYPFTGDPVTAGVQQEAHAFNIPPRVVQTRAKTTGTLPLRNAFVEVRPAWLVMSALKQSESGTEVILRLYNPTLRKTTATLKFFREIRKAQILTLEETPAGKLKPEGNRIRVQAGAKKIVTVSLKLGRK